MSQVCVVVEGGLGNQMFQVAAAAAHAKTHGCQLLIKKTKDYNDGRAMYWDSALIAWRPFLVDRLPASYITWKQPGNGAQTWDSPPIPDGPLRLHGYFQSSKYFRGHESYIRDLMRPSASTLHSIQSTYKSLLEIKDSVVVVHARRGDYCRDAGMRAFHGPLSVDYYIRTIRDMTRIVPDAHFLFVCESPDFWRSEVLSELGSEITSENYTILEEGDEIITLALLQQFKNFIIANSTFSWWAAWLAAAEHVFAPRAWWGPAGLKEWHDIYESDWVLY